MSVQLQRTRNVSGFILQRLFQQLLRIWPVPGVTLKITFNPLWTSQINRCSMIFMESVHLTQGQKVGLVLAWWAAMCRCVVVFIQRRTAAIGGPGVYLCVYACHRRSPSSVSLLYWFGVSLSADDVHAVVVALLHTVLLYCTLLYMHSSMLL